MKKGKLKRAFYTLFNPPLLTLYLFIPSPLNSRPLPFSAVAKKHFLDPKSEQRCQKKPFNRFSCT